MAQKRAGGGMSEQRRARLRLEISREAARLFWAQGVAGTSGDQIAEAVGLSTRTIWRHFRTKESCAEPIVMQAGITLTDVLRAWPRTLTLQEHLTAALGELTPETLPVNLGDELLGMQMIRLAECEPALRTAWLMACHQVETKLRVIFADRLQRSADDLDVRKHAAAASGALRVLDEHVGAAVLADPHANEFGDVAHVARLYAEALSTATGGAVGGASE